MMCSSRNAFTRSPISIALALGGGSTGMDIFTLRRILVCALSYPKTAAHFSGSCAATDPAHAGERGEVVVGVSEGLVDHRGTLEVVADLVLHRHADAAMQLDRAFADDLGGTAD